MKFCITTTDEFFSKDFNKYKKYLEKYNLKEIETNYYYLDNKKFFKHYIDINTIDEFIELVSNIKEQVIIYFDFNEFVIEIYNDYRE